MDEQDKELLLKDLCARLPYGVKVEYRNIIGKIQYIECEFNELCLEYPNNDYTVSIEDVKPYLRSIEDITNEEIDKLFDILQIDKDGKDGDWIKINDALGIKLILPNGRYIEDIEKALDYFRSIHVNISLPDHLYIRVTEKNNPYA